MVYPEKIKECELEKKSTPRAWRIQFQKDRYKQTIQFNSIQMFIVQLNRNLLRLHANTKLQIININKIQMDTK